MLASSPNPAQSRTFADLVALMQPSLRALDGVLLEQVSHFEPEVRELAAYCLESTGKRLRPMLVFLSGWRGTSTPDADLVRAAAVIEMTHLATLVHDDIMDQADLRRGRETISAKDGPSVAVLLGDALFAQSVWLSTQFPHNEVCRSVAEATRQVCTGEIIQTLGAATAKPSLERYHRIIDLKTAELFRVSCHLGAWISGNPAEYVAAASRFGRHLGIAYQIYDDLTDFAAATADAGKTLGTDWASGKFTLPVIAMLDRLDPAERERMTALLRSGQAGVRGEIATRMRAVGAFDEVARSVRAEIDRARAQVAPWEAIPAVPLLRELCDYLEGQLGRLLIAR